MPQPLIILGTGGNALDILDIVEAINLAKETWTLTGFLDDSHAKGSTYESHEILGGLRDAEQHSNCLFVNAIGSDKSYRRRPDIIAQTKAKPERFATLVHPLAAVSRRAAIGPGVCINAGAVVSGRTVIGSNVWIGAGTVIGSYTAIEDYAMISARAVVNSNVRVCPVAFIGAGACIRQRVTIGQSSMVALGGVVIADVAPGTTVVGNPARVLIRTPRQGKSGDTPPPRPGLLDTPSAAGGPPESAE